jgi:hypothetical protein
MPSTSWLATLSAAWNRGSRMALAIIVAASQSHGASLTPASISAAE